LNLVNPIPPEKENYALSLEKNPTNGRSPPNRGKKTETVPLGNRPDPTVRKEEEILFPGQRKA